MKNLIHHSFLICCLALGQASLAGTQTESVSGLVHHGNETIDALHTNGRVTLVGTKVTGLAEVNGSLTTKGAVIGSLNANGHTYLNNTKVMGLADITGFFTAENSSFDGELDVKAHKITLKNCTTNAIYVKKVMWPFDSQVVELLDGTVCNGNISFESGKGHVIVKAGSTLKGKVANGELEKQ